MRWEDERYVRVYTRETPEWTVLSWEARAVFHELLKKVDRAGIIMVGKSGMRGLAGLLRMPIDVVERGLTSTTDGLLEDGCVVAIEGGFMLPNFIEAQEAKQSDKVRKQAQRERDRTDRLGRSKQVTKRDEESQNVTECHGRSHEVTAGHTESLLAVPSRAEQSSEISSNSPPPIPPETRERETAGGGPEVPTYENPATAAIADALRASPELRHLAGFSAFVTQLAHHCREHGFTGQHPLAAVLEVIAEIGGKVARRAMTGSPMGYDAITELVSASVRSGPRRRRAAAPLAFAEPRGAPVESSAVAEVWGAYEAAWAAKATGPPPTLTEERRALIAERLQTHPASTLVAAVRGVWRSTWCVREGRTTLEHVLRDTSEVERHAAAEHGGESAASAERHKRARVRLELLAPPAAPTMSTQDQAAAARRIAGMSPRKEPN